MGWIVSAHFLLNRVVKNISEMVLSSHFFFNALRFFISLRGAVSQLRCDQGPNFVGAANVFKEALKQCGMNTLEAFLAEKQ